ncbi:uncharacterized protein VP01_5276g2, partial [Puccinia sorghi]
WETPGESQRGLQDHNKNRNFNIFWTNQPFFFISNGIFYGKHKPFSQIVLTSAFTQHHILYSLHEQLGHRGIDETCWNYTIWLSLSLSLTFLLMLNGGFWMIFFTAIQILTQSIIFFDEDARTTGWVLKCDLSEIGSFLFAFEGKCWAWVGFLMVASGLQSQQEVKTQGKWSEPKLKIGLAQGSRVTILRTSSGVGVLEARMKGLARWCANTRKISEETLNLAFWGGTLGSISLVMMDIKVSELSYNMLG